VLRTIWMAFRNTSLETQGDQFTGLANVRRLASDAMFWKAWRQTLEFTAVTTIVEMLLGLVIALALFKTFRGRGFVRAAVLVPWAIPPGLSDAARIDGASAWGYFWRVRLPLLMPTLLVAGHHSGGSPGRGPGRAARLHSLVE